MALYPHGPTLFVCSLWFAMMSTRFKLFGHFSSGSRDRCGNFVRIGSKWSQNTFSMWALGTDFKVCGDLLCAEGVLYDHCVPPLAIESGWVASVYVWIASVWRGLPHVVALGAQSCAGCPRSDTPLLALSPHGRLCHSAWNGDPRGVNRFKVVSKHIFDVGSLCLHGFDVTHSAWLGGSRAQHVHDLAAGFNLSDFLGQINSKHIF